VSARHAPDRNIAMELVRVTEAGAMAAARWIGRGNKESADQAAVDAMRFVLDSVSMRGVVVIGEGEKDEAPMLYNGEEVGNGEGPEVDVAVDPLEGTRLTALGQPGAIGFLTKDMTAEAIVRGLHTALDGQAPIRRSLLTSVIVAFQKVERRDRYGERAVKLSARELEVLGLVALGTRNREIADQLGISEFTVKRHVQNILHKLNVPSREVAAHIYRSVFGAEGTPQLAVTL